MFLTELDLRRSPEPDEWIVLADLVWAAGLTITVPRGFITDLASIPKPLRGLFDPNGRSRRAAVLHDWLYCSQRLPREAADDLFRRALESEGVGAIARNLYWAGVRAGGWRYYGKRAEGIEHYDFATKHQLTHLAAD